MASTSFCRSRSVMVAGMWLALTACGDSSGTAAAQTDADVSDAAVSDVVDDRETGADVFVDGEDGSADADVPLDVELDSSDDVEADALLDATDATDANDEGDTTAQDAADGDAAEDVSDVDTGPPPVFDMAMIRDATTAACAFTNRRTVTRDLGNFRSGT